MNFSVTEGRYVITAIFYFPAVKCGGFAFFFFSEEIQTQGMAYFGNEIWW